MSSSLLLRVFVNERLTAAAEEIFHVFERTIVKYEEEASSSKQEIDRLRGLLLGFMSKQKTDVSQSSVCKEATPPQQHHTDQELSVHQEDIEPQNIKEEAPERWVGQQQAAAAEEEEEEQVLDFKKDVLYQLHESVCEQEDTKPSLPNCEHVEEYEDNQETKTAHSVLPLQSAPSSQTLVQNKSVQDGRESERPAASFTEQRQTSFITARESTELPHINTDYQCYLCNKCFASSQHLINHAFRMHSNDTGVLCAVCGKTLESTESLNFHLQTHKSSKCCYMCGKHCNSTTALTEHMASHAGVKLHRCHVCGKECSRKGDLKIHMRIHTGEKPFCCSVCRKSFTHSGHLRKHMRSHTGERPHRCDLCGRGFLQSAHLKYHLGTHAQKY